MYLDWMLFNIYVSLKYKNMYTHISLSNIANTNMQNKIHIISTDSSRESGIEGGFTEAIAKLKYSVLKRYISANAACSTRSDLQ